MSNDSVVLFCEQLKLSVGALDPSRASRYLQSIDQLFNDRISESEIDLAIERVFKEDGGVLGFLKLTINQCKVFKNENVKSFDLLCKIIELHPEKVAQYATNTIIICIQYIRSMQPSAKEKEKSVAVIEQFVVKKCCDSVDRSYVMEQLLKIEKTLKTGIVLSHIHLLIGQFAKDYPDCIKSDDAPKIRDMYFKALEKAVIQQQDTSLVSLVGAFDGLNSFLENFGPSEEYEKDFAQRVYKCIEIMAKPMEGTKHKAVHKSALALLTKRCELFGAQIFDDFYFWHDLLVNTWLKMTQNENRRQANDLLRAIHREIASRLQQNSDSDGKRCTDILEFLQKDFKNTLQSSTSEMFEVRRAVVGFGLLGAPCKKLLEPKHLDELLNLVMQRTKCVANDVNSKQMDKDELQYFPEYVESLSKLMEQTSSLSGVQLNILQEIIVSVIRNFHLLPAPLHPSTINTLMRTFNNLLKLGGSVLDDILQKVIFQGVIWTCSHRLPFDANSDWEKFSDWKEHVTYTNYLPLWNGFLFEKQLFNHSYDRSIIERKIYDQMMHALIKILNKLDLAVRKRIFKDASDADLELFFSDPNYSFEPKRVKDFHIFFNLVDFYRAIWKAQSLESHQQNFVTWVNQLVEVIISKSREYPLVSGFMGLMQSILGITNRLDYFNNDLYECSSCSYNNVFYFLSSTIQKAQQNSGELQITCLKVLFTAPECMLCALIVDMIPVFQMAFDIGKSNASLFLAKMALNSIEKYMAQTSNRSSTETKVFLQAILPYFDKYLQGFKCDSDETVEINQTQRQRTAQKLIKIRESDLLKFQKRILFFLGSLEPEYCLHLVHGDGGAGEYSSLVKWSTTRILRLKLYGTEGSFPEICMDELVPRLCEIATTTTDRQKKMTACEILQATILYMLGSYNHRGKLWSELCQLMLELACDPDLGVKHMFEPLVTQTMHYISRHDQRNQDGTKILLDCLMNAISHPKNLSVRDLASRSLREFLDYSLKKHKTSGQSSSSFNIVTFIHKLKMYNCDALQQRRFGAALAFNNIYRVLREEDNTVDVYWIDLMHDLCINFSLSEIQLENGSHDLCNEIVSNEDQTKDDLIQSQSDLSQVSEALNHILRVLRERKDVFNISNADRIKPVPFSDMDNILLIDAVLWLFNQCNSTANSYRKKMMKMFLELAPCVEGYDSAAALVRDKYTIESLIELSENGIEYPQQSFDQADFEQIYVWLKHVNSSLDCYIWAIKSNFMPAWRPLFENGKIFYVLQDYITNVMNRNLFGNDDGGAISIVQKDKINAVKSVILLTFIKFLNETMSIDCVPNVIWEQGELLKVIKNAVFEPHLLECDTKNPVFVSNLSKELKKFIIGTFRSKAVPLSFRNNLSDTLYQNTMRIYESFSGSIDEILNRSSTSSSEQTQLNGIDFVCGLIRTEQIQSSGSLNSIDVLASDILYKVFEGIKQKQADIIFAKQTPSPDVRKFFGRLLAVCFNKKSISVNLIDLLLNTTELRLFESPQSTIKHGLHFLNTFKSTIYEYFLNNLDSIVGRLISKMLPHNVLYVLRILIELTDNAHKLESKNLHLLRSLTNLIVRSWSDILSKSKAAVVQHDVTLITTTLIELVGQVAMICPYSLAEIAKNSPRLESWLLSIIDKSDSDAEATKYSAIETKIQAIVLLPCVIGPATYEHDAVEKVLEYFQKLYFPLNTNELRMGTIERSSYENAFQTILDCMLASKSPLILKFIINCTAPDAAHIMEPKIIKIVRKFMDLLESAHQLHCLNMVFEMFMNKSLDPAIRTVIMDRFISYMVVSSTKETVTKFYAKHICTIGELVDATYNLQMKEFQLEQAFTSRIGGFRLLESLISIFTRQEICDGDNAILIAKFGKTPAKVNIKLLKWMTEKSISVKNAIFQSINTKYMEWFRKFQCAAFKCLCAIVGNTQKDENLKKFFEKYIFDEKNWSNIIDTSDSNRYAAHELATDEQPKIKKRLTSIRQSEVAADAASTSNRQRKYIESQTIFESSLSQDVTKIDLSSAYVRTAEEVEERSRLENYQPKELFLEQNSINDHEAMATVCSIIELMFENKAIPFNEDGTIRDRNEQPWVDSLCDLIANKGGGIHMNIRIFLATVVDNCSKWFCHFADDLTSAILTFLLDWIERTVDIDALSVFLIVDLLEWDSVYPIKNKDNEEEQGKDKEKDQKKEQEKKLKKEHEQKLASNLLTELMKRAYSENRDVFRRNLELIRNLTAKWRDFISIPYEFMYEKIGALSAESKSNICGIQLNAILLTNGLVPWNDETKPKFIGAILNCLNNNHTQVYKPAAQVLGMILSEIIVKQKQSNIDDEIQIVVDRLKKWKKTDEKKFMHVLTLIDRNYVIKGFLTALLTLVSSSSSDVKKNYLTMVLARIDQVEESRDIELMLLTLLDQSQRAEHQQQLIGLHVFNKTLANDKFTIEQIKRLLPLIIAFQDAKQTEIRDVVYEIMKEVRKKYGTDKAINTDTTKILLAGLNDVSVEIQRSVFEYWSQLPELPSKLSDRVLFILEHLYSSDFLKYGVQLLLDLKSDEFSAKLLQQHADDENENDHKHKEYDINVHWTTQDSSLRVPLFTESQQMQIVNGEMVSTQTGYLRATQTSLNFAPTMDPASVQRSSDTFSIQSQNSLQFEVSQPILNRRSQPTVRPTETAENAIAQSTKFRYLRQRILRNAHEQSRKKSINAIQHRDYRKAQEMQQQKHKAGQVQLYRRYRSGEFPDFFINSLAFLLPLKMLVGTDTILARNAFVTIVNAICAKIKNQDEKRKFLEDIAGKFADIIKQSNHCDSSFFSAVTEIILTNAVSLNLVEIESPNIVNDTLINTVLLLEKRLTNATNISEVVWAQLANLYYDLSEYDVAASIFADKITSNRLLSTAIEYESNGDFQNALKSYKEVIDQSADIALEELHIKHINGYCNQFAFNSAFNCFEVMGRWEDLEPSVIDQLRDANETISFEQLWEDEWNKNRLLPYYFRVELRTTLFYDKSGSTVKFKENVEEWLRNPKRAEYIKRHFGEELMVLYIANCDYNRAKVFSDQFFESFLDDWSAMNVLSEKVRINKLMNARRVAEIHKYADLLNGPISDTIIKKLCDRWNGTQIMQADPTKMWETIIAYRVFITEQVLKKYRAQNDQTVDQLIESMFDMQFKLNEHALMQHNFDLSKSVLGFLDSFRRAYGKDTHKSAVQYELAKICSNQISLKQKRENQQPEIILPHLLKMWTQLHQIQDKRHEMLTVHPDIHIKLMDQFNEVTDYCHETVLKCSSIDASTEQAIFELTGCMDESRTVSQEIESFFRRRCRQTLETIEKYDRSTINERNIGESYYRLAIFCLKHHRSGSSENQLEMSKLLIKSISRGMRHNSKNARLQFPRLLQLPSINSTELTMVFNDEMKQVPLWTFIGSISQIMSRLSFEYACSLDNLVLRLATEYPSIVIFPFQVAYERFKEMHPNVTTVRPPIQQIANAIANPFLQQFVSSLKVLNLPDNVLLSQLNEFSKAGVSSKLNQQKLKAVYDDVFMNPMRGKLPSKMLAFRNKFDELLQIFEREGTVKIEAKVKSLIADLEKSTKSVKSHEKLMTLCPMLSKHHWYGSMDKYIELPGQYTGNAAPNPSTSLKIVKFNEDVRIIRSLRKPLEISCICSDGKSYSFIVKCGEDLRRDERIQHVQELMSEQMQLDKNCSQQKLSLRTYKVIPLNTKCGLIKCVENSEPLSTFFKKRIPDPIHKDIFDNYDNFIENAANKIKKSASSNVKALIHYTSEQITRNLEECQKKIPENLLRQGLYQLSAAPECFFKLRNNFGKSLAVMCITHWLLGIGDRNLGNFLIDLNNGEMIGIDFNMAFGMGARVLNIPDVVPFRLTAQFVNALKPLETSGLLVKCMVHVLRTFNFDNESLMAALEVFVHDPTVDFAKPTNDRNESSSSQSIMSTASAWEPETHLKTIKDKLSGIDPTIPIVNDIKMSNHYSSDFDVVSEYTQLLNGSPNSYRYQVKKEHMTVKEQVKCLIDIAKDPAVLGVSYRGFQPWI